ncbi:unnamed protein product [Prunus armeniaca]
MWNTGRICTHTTEQKAPIFGKRNWSSHLYCMCMWVCLYASLAIFACYFLASGLAFHHLRTSCLQAIAEIPHRLLDVMTLDPQNLLIIHTSSTTDLLDHRESKKIVVTHR